MKLTTALATVAALLPLDAVADFDLYESHIGFVAGGGNGEVNPYIDEILVAQPYISYDAAICKAPFWSQLRAGSPYCDVKIKFNNGCAVLRNCGGGGEPHKLKTGDKFADLEDCGGGNRGTCYAWHDVASTHTCAWQEAGRMSYSRVACKTPNFNGAEALGEW
ncbi:uncharacterized protein E0L32_006317 [Thyridium curvatum]|uniref:Uncharacterized protein n=1 Tax=Thyridium curvatum TaxID=1093900 RepID=A0A507B3N7_9PEZI|nr:uncharacterized protein E0L32_006317 [Thyridium curvatum]TPX13344.1 hypothetical protein E0L32_006317 [Thyridium curvatum]